MIGGFGRSSLVHRAGVFRPLGRVGVCVRLFSECRDLVGGNRRILREGGERVDPLTVPVKIELARHHLRDGSDRQRIHIPEAHIFCGREILIADIAAAEDRRLVVEGDRLVVHAAIEATGVRDQVDAAFVAVGERIIEANLDVRMGAYHAQQQKHPRLPPTRGSRTCRDAWQASAGNVHRRPGFRFASSGSTIAATALQYT